MTQRRIHISILLMVMAIIAIGGFQMYWLRNVFRNEKRNLSYRTYDLFREAMQRAQADKLDLDTSIQVKFPSRYNAAGMLNIMRRRAVEDSLLPPSAATEAVRDTVHDLRIIDRPGAPGAPGAPGGRIVQMLRGVEPYLDSITAEEVSLNYAELLKKEGIDLGFNITKRRAHQRDDDLPILADDAPNEITSGISRPVTFRLDLEDTTWFVLRKITWQIMVSFLLVGLTIFSFFIMLRNLVAQRRLTQIKNDFISNITHELKTPIATVTVAVEALRNFNALNDPERTREYLDISANELQRLSLLVDKVLKLSMFEKQQIELREENVDLQVLVEEVVSSMKLQFEKYGAKVSIRPEGKNFVIRADRLHVTSVIFNLLDNALKYSKEEPVIHIDLSEAGDQVELSIADNGIGIAPEFKAKIFDKFFRVPTGDTHNVKGYGLGLSYVSYVVQRHRGAIDMESLPGAGSRFIIKLLKLP